MHLTFEEAKLQFNPDPNWWPARDSPDYMEIIQIMNLSGHISREELLGTAPKEITHRECLHNGSYVNPLTKCVADVKKPPISKRAFLSVRPNRDAVANHLYVPLAPIIARPELGESPPLPIVKITGRISKQEYLKSPGVKDYVDYHIRKHGAVGN